MKKNKHKNNNYIEFDSDSDDTFYYIADYTDGGAPFGVTWEEIISQELSVRPATKKDGKTVAELIHMAIGDIGTNLLKEAEKLAVQKGYHRISLNVAKENPSARKLYENLGYQDKKEIKINNHPYDYMVKML
jgi:GNAT superfamily N-acetyltransferase